MLDLVLAGGLVVCFVSAAVLAAAEVALLRVRRSMAAVDADRGDRRARHLLALLDDLPVVLNTVLLLVLLAQVGAATIAGFLAERRFGGIGVTVASVAVTATLFLYAEAIPKTMAVRSPYSLARRATPIIAVLVRIWRPIVAVLLRLADLQAPGEGAVVSALTEEEFRALARESASVGTIAETDAVLVDRSFEFGDQTLRDVMVPREKIVAVHAAERVVPILAGAIASGHRRLPVYRRNLDDVIGVVRLRDVAAATRTAPDALAEDLMSGVLRRPADYPIARTLTDMQDAGVWLAVVTEGRHVVGLVTIEDVVAELVGEIADERAVPRGLGPPPPGPLD